LRRALLALLALIIAGALAFYLLTMPATVPASALPAHTPDLANGKYMFTVGGCAECHAVPLKKCDDLKTKRRMFSPGDAASRRRSASFTSQTFLPTRRPALATGPPSTL
jgi:hypothetical protein